MKTLRFLLLFAMITLLAACGGGGGGGGTPSRGVTLTLSTTGGTAGIAGIDVTITLPDGVTPAANPVTVAGVAAPGTVLTTVYTPAVTTVPTAKGTLRFIMAKGAALDGTTLFGAGVFATVALVQSGTTTLLPTDFTLSGFFPYDVLISNTPVPGVSAVVTSVTNP